MLKKSDLIFAMTRCAPFANTGTCSVGGEKGLSPEKSSVSIHIAGLEDDLDVPGPHQPAARGLPGMPADDR